MASESLTEAEKLSEREVHEKTIAETLGTMYSGLVPVSRLPVDRLVLIIIYSRD